MGIMYKVLKHRYKHQVHYYGNSDSTTDSADLRKGGNSDVDNTTNLNWPVMDLTPAKASRAECQRRGRRRLSALKDNKAERLLLPKADENGAVLEQSLTVETRNEREFTAEHILQLCKFLAEKAKKNKVKQRLEEPPLPACNTLLTQPDANSGEVAPPNSAVRGQRLTASDLSTAYQSPDVHTSVDGRDHPLSTFYANTSNHGQPPLGGSNRRCRDVSAFQNKRDILLLKIRRQIFERKRQRQLTHRHSDNHSDGIREMSSSCLEAQHLEANVWRPW